MLAFWASVCVMAQVPIDGINYVLNDESHTATVVNGTYGMRVYIPATVVYDDVEYTVTAIGNSAFSGNSDLVIIQLPENLERIGDYAFYNCKKLKTINLSDLSKLKVLSDCAFRGCEKITICSLPESVTTLCNLCFGECASIESMSIGKNVNFIGASVFYQCSSLMDITVDEDNEYYKSVNGYVISKKKVTSFYSSSYSYPYEHILISAPNGRETLEIPADEGITHLMNGACSNTKVKKIVVPEGVERVNHHLGGTTLPSFSAFVGATNLQYVILPTTIWNYSQKFGSRATIFMAKSDIIDDYVFNKEDKTLVAYIGEDTNLKFPADYNGDFYNIGKSAFASYLDLESVDMSGCKIKSIGDKAFDCWDVKKPNFTTLTLSEYTESIGKEAFSRCNNLVSVDNATGLKSIGVQAFYDCSAMTDFDLKDNKVLTTISDAAFNCCKQLSQFSFPSTLTFIGGSAFAVCKLSSIDLSACNRLDFIGKSAFRANEELASVSLPELLLKIDDEAFSGCASLSEITLPSELMELGKYAFDQCTSLTSITVPDNIEELKELTFRGCSKLESVSLPSGLKTIGDECFSGCKTLTQIELPNGLTELGSGAFGGCSVLATINIPSGITEIKSRTFVRCSKLQIDIPSHITSIGSSAFEGSGITSVTIPAEVTELPEGVFKYCYSLESVIMNSKVQTIGENAFYDCQNLKSIELPVPMSSIGSYAFYNCFNLKEVNNYSGLTLEAGSTNHGNIAYYALSLINYKDIEEVGHFVFDKTTNTLVKYNGNDTEVVLPASYNGEAYVLGAAFFNNTNVTNVKFNSNVSSLGRGSFYGCVNLDNVELNENLSAMGTSCFEGCTSLTKMILPEGVTKVPDFAFKNCSSLRQLRFGDKTTYIGEDVALNCSKLFYVIIPASVTKISTNEQTSGVKRYALWGPQNIIDNHGFGTYALFLNSQGYINQTNATMTVYESKSKKYQASVNIATGSYGNGTKYISHPNVISSIDGVVEDELPFNFVGRVERNWSWQWGTKNLNITDGYPFYNSLLIYADNVDYERNFQNTSWQALYLPFDLDYEDWKDKADVAVFESAQGVDDAVSLNCRTVTNGKIPAYTPCLIRPFESGEMKISVSDCVMSPFPEEIDPVTLSTDKYIFVIKGNMEEKRDMFANQLYGLSNGLFCLAANVDVTLPPMRLYMEVRDRATGLTVVINPSQAQRVRVVVDGCEDTADSIVEAGKTVNTTNDMFDLGGRRISHPGKGIYIKNGKKVAIK